jgi:hypothetical protein
MIAVLPLHSLIAALPFRGLIAAMRQVAPANALRLFAVCAAFVALPVLAIHYAREPVSTAPMAGIVGLGGIGGAGASLRGLAVAVADDDPVARFSQTHVGHILYAPFHGDRCRRVLFNNRTGVLYENGSIVCVQATAEVTLVSGADRLRSLSRSFQR